MDNKLLEKVDLGYNLYEKMSYEQDDYRQWLLSQPPEEILNHAYEYAMREDILMAMETEELTDAQAQALLGSRTPLADVYREFDKLESAHMDEIRSCIESRANYICKILEEQRKAPIYPHNARYAAEHGEQEQYQASKQANLQCKEAIKTAVKEQFDGLHLCHDAPKSVIEIYGMDRVSMILASTVQRQVWDGRYSPINREWAKTVPYANPELDHSILDIHPAVLDGFIDLVRVEQQRSAEEHAPLPQGNMDLEM